MRCSGTLDNSQLTALLAEHAYTASCPCWWRAAPVDDRLDHQIWDLHVALGHRHRQGRVHAGGALAVEHRAAKDRLDGGESRS